MCFAFISIHTFFSLQGIRLRWPSEALLDARRRAHQNAGEKIQKLRQHHCPDYQQKGSHAIDGLFLVKMAACVLLNKKYGDTTRPGIEIRPGFRKKS